MKFLGTAWRNIRRSPYQAFAATSVMILTFLTFSIFAILIFSSSKVVDFLESRPQVTAFFKDEAKQEDINILRDTLNQSGIVSGAKFVSKDEALKIYKEQNKNDPLLLDLVTADILPSSLEISTYKVEDLSLVSDTLRKSTIVQEVVFQKDVVARLSSWTSAIRKLGFIIVAMLSTVSIFIMVTIIGVKISQKKEDIETMRLIGAGGWYIRWPFLLEGIFYCIFGALIGWIISMGALLYGTPYLIKYFSGMPIFPLPPEFLFALLGLEIVLAIILGAFSSYLAVLRYLK